MRRLRHTRVFFALAILVTGITGCSSLLPNSHSEASSFKTFEEARAAIESLIPMQSNQDTLTALGIEAGKQPNTTLLTHADVVRRFVPGSVLTKQDLNAGIVACIEAKDSCRGLEVLASRIDKVRSGNFFADFLNFVKLAPFQLPPNSYRLLAGLKYLFLKHEWEVPTPVDILYFFCLKASPDQKGRGDEFYYFT